MANKNARMNIATATAGTAIGTMPAAGTPISFGTSPWHNWTELAVQLTDDKINITRVRNDMKIQGPFDLAPEEYLPLQDYIDSVEFTIYEQASGTFTIDTTATDSSGTITTGATETEIGLLVEVEGLYAVYMPKGVLHWESIEGAHGETAATKYTWKPVQSTALSSSTNFDIEIHDG